MGYDFGKNLKVIVVVCASLLKTGMVFSQGINFMEPISWEKLVQLSKEQQRLIFIDFYTDWCGPCKDMDARVFSLPEVGLFYNSNFINVKVNAEKGEGIELAKKYNITAYPTYLFINEQGELVRRKTGSMPPDHFLDLGNTVLIDRNSEENIEEMKGQYPARKNDKVFMFRYLRALTKIQQPLATLINDYFELLTDEEKAYPENLQLVLDNGIFSNRKIILGAALDALLTNEKVYPLLKKPAYNPTPAMIATEALETSLGFAIAYKDSVLMKAVWEKAPDRKAELFDNRDELMLDYLFQTKQTEEYEKEAISYIENHLMKISLDTLAAMDKKIYEEQLQYAVDHRDEIIMRSGEKNVSPEYLSMYKRTQTIQLLNAINHHTEQLVKMNPSGEVLRKGQKWIRFIIRQSEKDRAYYHNVLPIYKILFYEIHYLSGRKKKAVKQMNVLIQSAGGDEYLVNFLERRKQKLIEFY